MGDPKADPRRRCMPVAEWPGADQRAWAAARAKGGLLGAQGEAADWSDGMAKAVSDAWGRYLTFLAVNGSLDVGAHPAERLPPDRLRAYIVELQATVAPVTVRNRIVNLRQALRVMAPGNDFAYLAMASRRLKARARPSRDKRKQIVPIQALFQLGLQLIDQAEHDAFARELWRAGTYRDGVLILILSCRPIRRGNLAAMRLGRHLRRDADAYGLAFSEPETKNRRRYDRPLDAALTPFIERYLAHYRPILLGEQTDDHVWISWRGRPMSDCSIYGRVMQHTEVAFGVGIPPHRFRDCAMTSLGEENPELIWLSQSLLHHADRRIAEKHYNQAVDSRAVAAYQVWLRDERRAAAANSRRRRSPSMVAPNAPRCEG